MLPTLIVIDVQRAFEDPAWGARNNPEAEANIAAALAAWRSARAPVVHIRHRSTSAEGRFVEGAAGFEFLPEAQPLPGEPIVTKTVNSAFIGTDLEAQLKAAGTTCVAFVGLTTDHCCSTTARMAANLGFETWVLADAMATHERTGPDGEHFSADLTHRAALASLHDEFAEVLTTDVAINRLNSLAAETPVS